LEVLVVVEGQGSCRFQLEYWMDLAPEMAGWVWCQEVAAVVEVLA
jgi:hypothetical protein